MGVGTLRCVVINVTDLQLAYKFWGVVTGLEVIGSETGWHDWLGYLGTKDPWKHEIILQRVDTSPLEIQAPNPEKPNQVHIDITPNNGIDQAIEAIVELGGKVKKAPSLYPRPGSHGDHRPLIDWARPVRQRVLPGRRANTRTITSGHGSRRCNHGPRVANRRWSQWPSPHITAHIERPAPTSKTHHRSGSHRRVKFTQDRR